MHKHHKHHEHAKRDEYKHHEAMIDNRKVHDNHQEGIRRVMQRKGDMMMGQGGKMGEGHHSESDWKRSGEALTPRRG